MSDFEIRPLTEREFPLWDDLIDESPQGTLFHQTFWLKASGREFIIYGGFKDRGLFAGVPLVHNRRFGIRQASRPILTPYSGVVFQKQNTKYVNRISQEKEISRQMARRLKRDFHLISFDFSPGSIDLQPFIWEGFSASVKYTYILNLENSLEAIWQSMEETRRRNIRKAEKDGISIVTSNDFEHTFNLVEKTWARQNVMVGFKSIAFSYHRALQERNRCQSFLAQDKDGDYIAMVYIVWDNKRSYYLLGGYDTDKRHHGASALAMWQAIKFTKAELGLREFDFEGSMVPQIEQFFRKFGGEQVPYYTVKWTKPYLNLPWLAGKVEEAILYRLSLS